MTEEAAGDEQRSNRSFALEWLHYHVPSYAGPVWFRVESSPEQRGKIHRLTALWGRWELNETWKNDAGDTRVFVHSKAVDTDPVRLQVLVDPPARIDFGQGSPPAGATTETAGSWYERGVATRGRPPGKNVFIVHGHDDLRKLDVARTLERVGLKVTILHEVANRGRAIIEKLEQEGALADFAVVLLTSDDCGGQSGDAAGSWRPRARQNVVLELGFFVGTLGRARVCALYEKGVELPSDYDGVLYIPLDGQDWKTQMLMEIEAAGLPVQWGRPEHD